MQGKYFRNSRKSIPRSNSFCYLYYVLLGKHLVFADRKVHKPLKLIVTSTTGMRRQQLTVSMIATLSFVLFLAQPGLTSNASFAQTPNITNQTSAKITGQPEITVLNKTSTPAQQTTVTVNQTSEPMTNQALQPLENLTNQTQPLPSLSGIENKTMVEPTGNATTTVVNQTTVPFNQTTVSGSNNQSQQEQTSNATSTPTPAPSPPTSNISGGGQGNQSQQQQQQGNGNPLSKIPILGELFGGK
jgi:hypothetical protein